MNKIEQLHGLGQSIWLDYIERGMIHNGELQQLVADGLRGVTSNPTIFQQAISKSDAYKSDLQTLAKQESDPKTIFEQLAIADIQAACDILRPAYDAANGADGFVSIEVAPDLAYDTDATIAEARKLHSAIDRPNLMVKVPATAAGLPAIRQLTADGINVNVTLIFALERYAEVKDAYLNGLEDRLKAGKPLDHISSVASFFVSRVDVEIDKRLEKMAEQDASARESLLGMRGKAAIANAKLAYRQFQQVFSGSRWQTLAEKGAQLQRPLWASTSTKHPDYPDLLYVDNLIGPHTVNTMPPATLEAFLDHGVVERTVDDGLEEAQALLVNLESVGISMREVTDLLEREGVKKFADSYDELLETIAQRRKELVAA